MEKGTSAVELVSCAQINLQNLKEMVPILGEHPVFKIVEVQIAEAIKALQD